MTDWTGVAGELESLLRLRTLPVGLQLLRRQEDLQQIRCRRPDIIATLCQLIAQARTAGTTIGFTASDLTPLCATVAGLRDTVPEWYMLTVGEVWFKNKEDALDKYTHDNWPRIADEYEACVLSPVAAGRIEPDMIILYGNAAQVSRIVSALQWERYERLEFSCCGESACSDSIGKCYVTGKPAVGIPCFGERRFGYTQDDELMVALPPGCIDSLITGLKALDKAGIRYPVAFAGAQMDPLPGFPPAYREGILRDHEERKSSQDT